MTKEKFILMTNKILINIDEKVLDSLQEEFYFIQENMKRIENINIEGVEPMARISKPITFLREDIEGPSLDKKKLLSNATYHDDDYVIMKRILK
ncbi:MAG: Asp-tRNA(Asn)/Glu-tRNA(Gln) amidotransferase subunit GatC [Metamycoplasmataceae bacterium]